MNLVFTVYFMKHLEYNLSAMLLLIFQHLHLSRFFLVITSGEAR